MENESVIASILKMYGDKVRLVDARIDGFRFQSGLKKWKFMVLKNKEELERIQKENSSESMFHEFEREEEVTEDVAR